MSPDDPRHGTNAGYHAGCRESCCRRARARYEKKRRVARARGNRRKVPVIGAQRRIRALMALGWDSATISEAAGFSGDRNAILRIVNGQHGKPSAYLMPETHDRIREVYDKLSMKLPPRTPVSIRTANIARRKGFLPPLMWDDERLDDPEYQPSRREREKSRVHEEADEAVVLRILSGERLEANAAERREVLRRWSATGRSIASMCREQGWKQARDYRLEDEQEAS